MEGSTKQQISADGGSQPVWSQRWRELFYRREDEVMAVSINATSGFKTGVPRMVAEGTSVDDAIISQRFVPAPDSKPAKPIVVLNWVEELKRLVPTE